MFIYHETILLFKCLFYLFKKKRRNREIHREIINSPSAFMAGTQGLGLLPATSECAHQETGVETRPRILPLYYDMECGQLK